MLLPHCLFPSCPGCCICKQAAATGRLNERAPAAARLAAVLTPVLTLRMAPRGASRSGRLLSGKFPMQQQRLESSGQTPLHILYRLGVVQLSLLPRTPVLLPALPGGRVGWPLALCPGHLFPGQGPQSHPEDHPQARLPAGGGGIGAQAPCPATLGAQGTTGRRSRLGPKGVLLGPCPQVTHVQAHFSPSSETGKLSWSL